MFYGIESTTDSRNPEITIRKFRSEHSLLRWIRGIRNGAFAWSGAADPNLPMGQQNFHRRFRCGYEMPRGFRLTDRDVEKAGGSRYGWSRTKANIISSNAIRRIYAQEEKRS